MVYAKHLFVMSSLSSGNLQTNDGHSIYAKQLYYEKNLFLFFFGTKKKNYQQKQSNDKPTIILNLLK